MSLRDDGIGFDPSAPRTSDGRDGYGLGNLRERVEALRGKLGIVSRPGGGTRLDVRVPWGAR
jgi:signal transduction histidine kinase